MIPLRPKPCRVSLLALLLVSSGAPSPVVLPLEDGWAEGTRVLSTLPAQGMRAQFGYAAANAGDLDGDGVSDVILGSPFAGRDETEGCIHAHSGRGGAQLFRIEGRRGDLFGWSLAAAGDVDGDGRGDVVVGAPQPDIGAGRIAIHSGRDGALVHSIYGTEKDARFGQSVAGCGDLDGDGLADILVGEPGSSMSGRAAGRAVVLSGANAQPLREFYGETKGARFGQSVAGAAWPGGGSILAVGAPLGGRDGGRVSVWTDSHELPSFEFELTGGGALVVAISADVDGDGKPDVLASDWKTTHAGSNSTGTLVLHSGATGERLLELPGRVPGEGFGIACSGAGDLDGDGLGDLLVGAWLSSEGALRGGKVYALRGTDGAELYQWTGQHPAGAVGFGLAGLDDIDRDGRPDLLVTAPHFSLPGLRAGRAWILPGAEAVEPRGAAQDPAQTGPPLPPELPQRR